MLLLRTYGANVAPMTHPTADMLNNPMHRFLRRRVRPFMPAVFSPEDTIGRRYPGSRLLLALCCGLVSMPAFADAWTQKQGQALWILKGTYSDSGKFFNDSHHRGDFGFDGKSRQEQLNLYIEYGLTDRMTFVGNFYASRFGYRNQFSDQSRTGFSDQEAGLRYALDPDADGPWVGALQALVVFPGYGDHDDDSGRPVLGLGGHGLELRYSVGRGYNIGTHSAYVDMGAAVRLRSGDAADEVRAAITSGVALTPSWMAVGEVNVIQGLGNGKGTSNTQTQDTVDYDLTKLQLSALYTTKSGMQLQLGWQQPVLGRNTGAGGGPLAALWWRY